MYIHKLHVKHWERWLKNTYINIKIYIHVFIEYVYTSFAKFICVQFLFNVEYESRVNGDPFC